MNWQVNPYSLALFASAIVCGGTAWYAWQKRPAANATWLAVLLASLATWAFGYGVGLGSNDLVFKIFWAKVQYFGVATVATTIFIIVLTYTGRGYWLTPSTYFLLALEPALTILLAWTNEWHHLIWDTIVVEDFGVVATLKLTYGLWFWVAVLYSYVFLLLSTTFLCHTLFKASFLQRRQAAVMLVGISFPWLANFFYIIGLRFFPHPVDLTPFANALAGLILTWALTRIKMLDIIPIAQQVVIEGIPDGVIVLDARDRVVEVNPAGRHFFHQTTRQLMGKPITELLNQWPGIEQLLTPSTAQFMITVPQAHQTATYEVRLSALLNGTAETHGRVMVIRDITAQKEAEETLQQYARQLEIRNQELDDFAHTVAHDLKNPLTAITGYSGLLISQWGKLNQEHILNILRTVERSSHLMGSIIHELLLLASVRQKNEVLQDVLDMPHLLRSIRFRLSYLLEEYQAELQHPEEWPDVVSYPPWIEAVWSNYISNAIKYGGRPPVVQLGWDELPATTQHPKRIRFWVKDNGQGLTTAQCAKLFTPFTRLEEHGRAEGHGVGLSIVQRIMEKLEGEVGVESTPGQGSLFWFTLRPYEEEPPPAA